MSWCWCQAWRRSGRRSSATSRIAIFARASRRRLRLATATIPTARRNVPMTGADMSARPIAGRSEEHTSELQSLMRISYAVFCLKKKKNNSQQKHSDHYTTNDHDSNTRLRKTKDQDTLRH